MEKYYLAVDIGASSGRHILGCMRDGRLELEEIYRFGNGMTRKNGHLCWDTERLFSEIKAGMKRAAELGHIPHSVGIDTWAVDFVLLDSSDRVLGDTVAYRDSRTEGMDEKVSECISPAELYQRTGIQKQSFNTIYQLEALATYEAELLSCAESLLMIPDYFHFLLTGEKVQEYTNATTTGLVSPVTDDWDRELIQRLGFPDRLFGTLSLPGTTVGSLRPEISAELGFQCEVVLPPTHDTASAVLAVPYTGETGDILYISSGTWSLMGTELPEADCSEESRLANFTNEGGYGRRFRYLKNIMGLWMIQSVRGEWKAAGADYSFAEICEKASKESIASIVDCDDPVFLAPEDMNRAVRDYLRESGQQVPETPWETAAVIYRSLAACYGRCLRQLEDITGRSFHSVNIVGGGSNADYLNQLTADVTGRTVYAGPGEATAIGNIVSQIIRAGELNGIREARKCIFDSFSVRTFEPGV